MKNIFTLSGKKKIFALLAGLLTAAITKDAANYSHLLGFLTVTVSAYLFAESSVDRQRAWQGAISTIAYNLKNFQVAPAEQTTPSDVVEGEVVSHFA